MNNEPIVLQSNQNQAQITDNGICPTLVASMGLGGGYIPTIVQSQQLKGKEIYGKQAKNGNSKCI